MPFNLVTCPYCGAESFPQNISFYGGDGNKIQMMCLKCNKIYLTEMRVIKTLFAEKADCLNGGEHIFEAVCVLKNGASFYKIRKCTVCGTTKTTLKNGDATD